MAKGEAARVPPSNNDIRRIMLQYFYDRNTNATSSRGKKGSAVKMSDVKKELKVVYGLTQPEVQSNLTYLISQGWVEEDTIEKSFTAPGGTVIPSSTSFFRITAAGIDKIEGPGEFTMPKFHGIKIEATGQNIITLGDGNQIQCQIHRSRTILSGAQRCNHCVRIPRVREDDLGWSIETIQSQLAKPEPNRDIIRSAWETIKGAASINDCASLVQKVVGLIGEFL